MPIRPAPRRAPFAPPLLVGLLASVLPLSSRAATDPPRLDKVEVTGSNIRRLAAEGASPLQVLTREAIEQSGVTTAAELLDTVVANNNAGGQYRTNNTNNTVVGGSGVSLRGLGPNSTLVLLNGRRIAFYGFSDQSVFVDLGSIPISAIERVEIVKDGASAIYGSDALAGVVNFILRRSYQGLDLRASAGRSLSYGDNAHRTLTVSGGKQAGPLSLMGVVEAYHQQSVQVSERLGGKQADRTQAALEAGYSGTSLSTGTGIGGNYPATSSGAGNWYSNNPANGGRVEYYAAGACNTPNLLHSGSYNGYSATGICLDTETDRFNTLSPEVDKLSFFGRAGYELGAGLSAFAELAVARIEQRYAYWPTFKNDYYDGGSTPHFPFAQAPAGWGYYARLYDELGSKIRDLRSDSHRLVLGLKGVSGRWDWEAALTRSDNRTDFIGSNYIRSDRWYAGVADGSINPFEPLTTANIEHLRTVHTRQGRSRFTLWDATASTPLALWSTGTPYLALGLNLRDEAMSDGIDADSNAGKVENASVRLPVSAGRKAQAVYAELSLPLHATVEAQLALRHDHFGRVGSSTNPKAALKWTPSPQLALRASYTTGFRAPSLAEMHGGIRSYANCPSGASPVCPDYSQVWGNQVTVSFLDSLALQPEKSRSGNLGLIWEPLRGHSLSADAWQIERRNQVYAPAIANPADADYFSLISPASNAAAASFQARYVNLGRTEVQGLDIGWKSHWSLGAAGQLKASLTSSNMRRHEVEFRGSRSDFAGLYGYPKWRHRADLAWSNPDWTVALAGNHRGAFEQTALVNSPRLSAPSGVKVKSFSTLDLYLAYRGLAKGLSLAAGLGNLTGKAPPFDRAGRLGTLYEDNSDRRTGHLTLDYRL